MARAVTQLSETQANKTATINEIVEALLAAADFGIDYDATDGLTFGYFGGELWLDGVLTTIADGTLLLTASATNYIERTQAGTVSKNTSGFTAGQIPLYEIVTSSSGISTLTDRRVGVPPIGAASVSLAGSPSTIVLTAALARARIIRLTGALTGAATVVFPAVKDWWIVYDLTTGGQAITLQSAAGGSPTPRSISMTSGSKIIAVCDGEHMDSVGGGSSNTVESTYGARGVDCQNTPGSPLETAKFDLDADEIVLRNSTGSQAEIRIAPGAAITNDTGLAGPVANGRDQAGAFASDSWVHFYWIWNGATLATVSSTAAPPTGPTLPSGYTHWAYAGPVRKDSSGNLLRVRIKGNRAYYGTIDATRPVVLTGGSATSETAVDVSSYVPPNAPDYALALATWALTSDGSGNIDASLLVRIASGINYFTIVITLTGLGAGASQRFDTGGWVLVPNVGQQFYYDWDIVAGTSPFASMFLYSYGIPNGA